MELARGVRTVSVLLSSVLQPEVLILGESQRGPVDAFEMEHRGDGGS